MVGVLTVASGPPQCPELGKHDRSGGSMSEDSVTFYKEVFDENSEPTDKGEQNIEDSRIDTKHVDE